VGEPAGPHDGYAGPATLTVDGWDVPVQAVLDARHEPQDGRMHWFGRVTVDAGMEPGGEAAAALAAALSAPSARVELSTGTGRAQARIGDVDPWGRFRVTGVGPPPFRLDEPDLDD
jgi:hypothetical protein